MSQKNVLTIACAGLLLLALLVGSIVVCTSKLFFDNDYELRSPAWITKVFIEGRMQLGKLREAPSNDEMIRYYQQHSMEFESLVKSYYEQLRTYYEASPQKLRFPDIDLALQAQMTKLGVMKIHSSGPYLVNSIYGKNPFQRLGVQFMPIDKSGLSSADGQTRLYIYAPRVSGQASINRPPISQLFNSGEYGASSGVPAFCKERDYQCCGLQIFTDNWAIANCIHSEIY